MTRQTSNKPRMSESLFDFDYSKHEPVEESFTDGICPHCNAKMVEYKHGLSKALVEGLTRLANKGIRVNIKDLGLTRNQWDNFQKLRYWDLVEKANPNGNQKGGWWMVTILGIQFLKHGIAIPKTVVTYRGSRIRFEGENVFVNQVVEGYMYRNDYIENSAPHI